MTSRGDPGVIANAATVPSQPDAEGPAISVVLVTASRFQPIRRTVRHLRAQTCRDRLELVIVAPSSDALDDAMPGELDGFGALQVVPVGPIENLDKAAAPGLLRATAPVVALVEDHAYPEPQWAEALVEAHRGSWVAVGSAVVNANPDSVISWMNLLIAYGPFSVPTDGGETETLPVHNVSFKRAALASFGDRLGEMLGRDGNLMTELRAAGGRFFLAAGARIAHVNPSLLSPTLGLRFKAGRLNGGVGARERWTAGQRLFYLVVGPLVPLVNFQRARRRLFTAGRRRELAPRVYPALLLGFVVDGVGQMVGNVLGPGTSARELARFEFDRMRHVTPSDRARFME